MGAARIDNPPIVLHRSLATEEAKTKESKALMLVNKFVKDGLAAKRHVLLYLTSRPRAWTSPGFSGKEVSASNVLSRHVT